MAVKPLRGIAPSAALLCVAAAAAASVPAALLYTAGLSVTLLLTTAALAVLAPLSGGTRGISALLLTAALGGALRMLLSGYAPDWCAAMGPPVLYYAAFLLCAPVAELLADAPERAGFRRLGLPALALLVIGIVRELLSAGTLMGVRLMSPFSAAFGIGVLGLTTAGLIIALLCLRKHPVFGYSVRGGCVAGVCLFVGTTVCGILFSLVCRLLPIPERLFPLLAVLLTGLAALAGGRLFRGNDLWGPPFADRVLTVASALAILVVYRSGWSWAQAVWMPVAAAAVLGLAFCLIAAAMTRIDNIHLPAPFKSAPAVLVAAGTVMLALSVL